MLDPVLDFRFSWRWLLPLTRGDRVGLIGYDGEQASFWEKAFSPLGISIIGQQGAPNVWLVSITGGNSQPLALNQKKMESLSMVCVYGQGRAVRGWCRALEKNFSEIREYGLLPPSNPRLAIPLSQPFNTAEAMELHSPGRRIYKLFAWLVGRLAMLGFLSPFRRKVLLIASKTKEMYPVGAKAASFSSYQDQQNLDYALYLGRADENRKTVILPIGEKKSDFILKMAETPKAVVALKNEATTLKTLAETTIAKNSPRIIAFVEKEGMVALYQEYRKRTWARRKRIDDDAVEFLAKLSKINCRLRPLGKILQEISKEHEQKEGHVESEVFPSLLQRLKSIADQGFEIREHMGHGDFAPWNCSWTEKGFFVYDWEESRQYELAYSDAFYYTIAPAVFIEKRSDPAKVIKRTLAFAKSAMAASGIKEENISIYLALWLLKHRRKSFFYDSMIDALVGERLDWTGD